MIYATFSLVLPDSTSRSQGKRATRDTTVRGIVDSATRIDWARDESVERPISHCHLSLSLAEPSIHLRVKVLAILVKAIDSDRKLPPQNLFDRGLLARPELYTFR